MNMNQIKIPEGVDTVQVSVHGDRIVVEMVRKAQDFTLDITGTEETRAEEGDLAVLWDSGREWAAVVTFLEEKNLSVFGDMMCPYKGANQVWYEHAIRFRDLEQFSKIINHKRYVVEQKKEKEGR